MLKIEMLRADQGDCFLIHYGTESDPKFMLFDGGPPGVWTRHLEPRLVELKRSHSPNAPLPLELVAVTHIDSDHIQGIIDLTDDLRGNQAPRFDIKNRWFNSFGDITGDVTPTAMGSFVESAGSDDWSDLVSEYAFENDRTEMILLSLPQGDTLRDNFANMGLVSNFRFPDLVKSHKKVRFPGGPELHVIGPLPDQLDKLERKWTKHLDNIQTAEYLDSSVPNLSSIAVLLEQDGKKVLMTGDARGDHLLKGLKEAGLLDRRGKISVDILKLPHHGSDNNVTKTFFKKITASTYLISANGDHHNPDPCTLKWLVESRKKTERFEIVFSNKMYDEVEQRDLEYWMEKLQRERSFTYRFIPETDHSTIISL